MSDEHLSASDPSIDVVQAALVEGGLSHEVSKRVKVSYRSVRPLNRPEQDYHSLVLYHKREPGESQDSDNNVPAAKPKSRKRKSAGDRAGAGILSKAPAASRNKECRHVSDKDTVDMTTPEASAPKSRQGVDDMGNHAAVSTEQQGTLSSMLPTGELPIHFMDILNKLINDAVLTGEPTSSHSEMVNVHRLCLMWAYFENSPSEPGPMSTLTVTLLRILRLMVWETTAGPRLQ